MLRKGRQFSLKTNYPKYAFDLIINLSVSPCTDGVCKNGGTCSVMYDGKFNCSCEGDWMGDTCDCKYIYIQLID